jgi:osmotically-inducible protein OsmY
MNMNVRSNKISMVLLLTMVILLQGCTEAIVAGGMGTLVALHDARSTRHWYQDQAIEKDARRLLKKDSSLDGRADINVVSYNRQVLLTGAVASGSLSRHAARLVAGVRDVRKVFNELTVTAKGNVSGGDGMLATRLKARLFFNDFDATRVKVISSSGHVYLMGLVSHAESDKVVAMLNDFDGVNQVTRMFEYVD